MQGLSGQGRQRERQRTRVAASAAMSTHQRCHLAPQASNQSPKGFPIPLSLSLSLSATKRFMHSSYGGPDGNFIVRRATAKLRPHWGLFHASFQTNMSDCSLLADTVAVAYAAAAVAVAVVVVLDISVCLSVVAHARVLCFCRLLSLFCFCFRHWNNLWIW